MIHDGMAWLREHHPAAWLALRAVWLLVLLVAVWQLWDQPGWELRYLGL